MITEDYCSYEVAKLLKEKGFEILTGKVYDNQNKLDYQNIVCWQEKRLPYISAPTHQRAMKWLREVHNIFIEISVDEMLKDEGYQWAVYDNTTKEIRPYAGWGGSYEEACEEAMKYVLENLI